MAAQVSTRQPFADLDSSRLQSLQSTKNRQNAITAALSPSKTSLSPSVKRRISSTLFDDDFDSENVNPEVFNSPSKRSKAISGTSKKPSRFVLTTAHQSTKSSTAGAATSVSSYSLSPFYPQRNAISSPTSTSTTPMSAISARGGSPKHKRVGLLSKRRVCGSRFTRVDPPFFSRANASSLPFSLDAALSGTISSYTPKSSADVRAPTLEESMPKSWFFEIHEDTPEEEATNLMEHSACTLDISSDDDTETKLRNEAKERGKENIPPPDYLSNSIFTRPVSELAVEDAKPVTNEKSMVSYPPLNCRVKVDTEEMSDDRLPLSDLRPTDYYVVNGDVDREETSVSVASPLSQGQKNFDFEHHLPRSDSDVDTCAEKKDIAVWEDGQPSKEISQNVC